MHIFIILAFFTAAVFLGELMIRPKPKKPDPLDDPDIVSRLDRGTALRYNAAIQAHRRENETPEERHRLAAEEERRTNPYRVEE